MGVFSITSCYAFFPIGESGLGVLRTELLNFGKRRGLEGLTLIATEGINATVCGSPEAIAEWKAMLTERFGHIVFKDSTAPRSVFRRFSVKIKPEIVGLKKPDVRPQGRHRHLSPEEWEKTLEQEDVVLVDTRNSYEYSIGKFRGAIDCGTDSFGEFPAFVEKAKLPKDKKILMYCTGGIRCEKALLEMESQGYDNVYQLEGGILGYLEKFPHKHFEGECFVFDYRVAVNQELRPSDVYGLCPHCGLAGSIRVHCRCGKQGFACGECLKDPSCRTCSKRCRNEVRKAVATTRTSVCG
ncbi:hypothetical protein FJZ28_05500 [Candidatus Peregrinibacteria bacterium]|nr:hypothetical protein [Candidatus Peregrinibacteria bacterium]